MNYEQIQKYWDKQTELMKKILQLGMAEYVKGIANLANAFRLADKWLRCIDEGNQHGIL